MRAKAPLRGWGQNYLLIISPARRAGCNIANIKAMQVIPIQKEQNRPASQKEQYFKAQIQNILSCNN